MATEHDLITTIETLARAVGLDTNRRADAPPTDRATVYTALMQAARETRPENIIELSARAGAEIREAALRIAATCESVHAQYRLTLQPAAVEALRAMQRDARQILAKLPAEEAVGVIVSPAQNGRVR